MTLFLLSSVIVHACDEEGIKWTQQKSVADNKPTHAASPQMCIQNKQYNTGLKILNRNRNRFKLLVSYYFNF